ncbi:MAG TPA: hypothetical protein ENI70_00075 [Candidatus Peregrinibacteria bacterium]|nr:hypothetical protein [Candidatus Peregrinibacteria bacterium]
MNFLGRYLDFRNKGFPGQQEGEVVELHTTLHWVVLLPMFIGVLVVIAILILVNLYLLSGYQDSPSLFLVAVFNSTVIILIAHFFFIRLLNYFLRIILITNYRIIDIKSTVFLRRERTMVDFGNIQDIKMSQVGVVARLLNFGQIAVISASGQNVLKFDYVPKTLKFYNIINHIYRKKESSQEKKDRNF